MRFVTLARVSELPEGEARVFDLGDRQVFVCRVDGAYHACDNVCPHRGGPVGEGSLDGSLVTCPWHGWQFDVTTGVNPLMPAARLATYPVKVEGEHVQLGLE